MSKSRKQGHWLLEYYDETSQYDPLGKWDGGEGYTRWFRAWIPKKINKDDDDSIQSFLECHPQAYID